jgi:hypothetical protein
MDKNFNFEGLTVHTRKCLYISNNKAILRNKKLYCISDIINNEQYNKLYVEECFRDSKSHNDYAIVYIDLDIICMSVGYTLDGWATKDHIIDRLLHLIKITLESTLTTIRSYPENRQFVNVADIKLLELAGAEQEEINKMIQYRQDWYNRKDKEYQEREQKKQQEEKEFVENRNNIIAELIIKTEQAIIDREKVKNEHITIYKTKYEYNDISLILYIMKSYNIKIPLKTQGWINQALANIFYSEDYNNYSYQYYTSSKNSTVFQNYLEKLVTAIKEKYGVIEEQEEIDPEIKKLFGLV